MILTKDLSGSVKSDLENGIIISERLVGKNNQGKMNKIS